MHHAATRQGKIRRQLFKNSNQGETASERPPRPYETRAFLYMRV